MSFEKNALEGIISESLINTDGMQCFSPRSSQTQQNAMNLALNVIENHSNENSAEGRFKNNVFLNVLSQADLRSPSPSRTPVFKTPRAKLDFESPCKPHDESIIFEHVSDCLLNNSFCQSSNFQLFDEPISQESEKRSSLKRSHNQVFSPEKSHAKSPNEGSSLVTATKRLKISERVYSCTTATDFDYTENRLSIRPFSVSNFGRNDDANNSNSLEKSSDSFLVGDLSRQCYFPITMNGNNGLPLISCRNFGETLSATSQEFISTFELTIVDCRYPYEFNGGHITGAINLYSYEDIHKHFLRGSGLLNFTKMTKKPLIVFHCEFSSKRGPKLARMLRNCDRKIHKNCYPKLYFPEVYILDGGYREFFNNFSHLCVPTEYVEMTDRRFDNERIHYAKQSRMGVFKDLDVNKTKSILPEKKRIL